MFIKLKKKDSWVPLLSCYFETFLTLLHVTVSVFQVYHYFDICHERVRTSSYCLRYRLHYMSHLDVIGRGCSIAALFRGRFISVGRFNLVFRAVPSGTEIAANAIIILWTVLLRYAVESIGTRIYCCRKCYRDSGFPHVLYFPLFPLFLFIFLSWSLFL